MTERPAIPCALVQELLPLYLDGELGPEAEEQVREHLQDCPQCRREAERARVREATPSPGQGTMPSATVPDASGQGKGRSNGGSPDLERQEQRVLRRVGRMLLIGMLIAAVAVGGVGVYSYVTGERLGRRALINAFITGQVALAAGIVEAAGPVEAVATSSADREELLQGSMESLQQAYRWLKVLEDICPAVLPEQDRYDTQLISDALHTSRWVGGSVAGRWRTGQEGPLDPEFLTELGALLRELAAALRPGPQTAGGSRPRLDWSAERPRQIATAAEAVRDLCGTYRAEGALEPGTRLPAVGPGEAVARAQELLGVGEQTGGEAQEFIDWWHGVHYWRVDVPYEGPKVHPSARARVWIDARDGQGLGFSVPWVSPASDEPPAVSGEEAVAAVRAYLARGDGRFGLPEGRSYLLTAYVQGGGSYWDVVFVPAVDGVVYYSDPLEVRVSGADAAVVGCAALTRPAAASGGWSFDRSTAGRIGAERLARLMDVDVSPEPESVERAVYRFGDGGTRCAWAVTVESSESYRKEHAIQRPDEEGPDPAPTHVVAFVDGETGAYLGRQNLWLEGSNGPGRAPQRGYQVE